MTLSYNRLLVCLFFILFCSCNFPNKEQGCSRFKTGDFFVYYKKYPGLPSFLINRTDSVQTEVNQQTGSVTKFSVKWTDSCSYDIKMISTSEAMFKEDVALQMRPIKVQIISWNDSSYVFRSNHPGSKQDVIDTVWVKR